jgi:hypothetical protein
MNFRISPSPELAAGVSRRLVGTVLSELCCGSDEYVIPHEEIGMAQLESPATTGGSAIMHP